MTLTNVVVVRNTQIWRYKVACIGHGIDRGYWVVPKVLASMGFPKKKENLWVQNPRDWLSISQLWC